MTTSDGDLVFFVSILITILMTVSLVIMMMHFRRRTRQKRQDSHNLVFKEEQLSSHGLLLESKICTTVYKPSQRIEADLIVQAIPFVLPEDTCIDDSDEGSSASSQGENLAVGPESKEHESIPCHPTDDTGSDRYRFGEATQDQQSLEASDDHSEDTMTANGLPKEPLLPGDPEETILKNATESVKAITSASPSIPPGCTEPPASHVDLEELQLLLGTGNLPKSVQKHRGGEEATKTDGEEIQHSSCGLDNDFDLEAPLLPTCTGSLSTVPSSAIAQDDLNSGDDICDVKGAFSQQATTTCNSSKEEAEDLEEPLLPSLLDAPNCVTGIGTETQDDIHVGNSMEETDVPVQGPMTNGEVESHSDNADLEEPLLQNPPDATDFVNGHNGLNTREDSGSADAAEAPNQQTTGTASQEGTEALWLDETTKKISSQLQGSL